MNGLLTTTEAMDILNISYKTLLKHIHTGQLKVSNIGTKSLPRYRIRQADLDEFLKGAGGGTTGDTQK